MYFDPAGITLGQMASTLRDFTVVGFLLASAWRLRGAWELGKKFFERWTSHMNRMETGMDVLLHNHLRHIQDDLSKMTHRQVRATGEEQVQYESDDEFPEV
jgi:hypothetical protein